MMARAEEAMARQRPLDWSAPFEALQVGQRFQSEPRQVREADVLGFCALSGDWHPQHWDATWASRSAFGERIAHGMLVLSLAVGLVPFDPGRVRALRRIGDTVFKRPVRFGEQVAVSAEVSALKPVDEQAGLVEVRLAVKGGQGALVARGSVQVLWSCEHAAQKDDRFSYWNDAVPDTDGNGFPGVAGDAPGRSAESRAPGAAIGRFVAVPL